MRPRRSGQWCEQPEQPPEQLPELQPEQLELAELAEGRSEPLDLNAKVESLRLTSTEPQEGQGTVAEEENTSSSKSSLHASQLYS